MQLLIAGVITAFKWLGDRALTFAQILWQVTVVVGKALAWFAIHLGDIFGKVYQLLGRFWSNVLRPFVAWTWGRIDKLVGWLNRTFGPVLKFLELLRAHVLQIYDRYFRPIFDTIEVVRRVLQLMAALRIDWARELDRKLAELEDRLLWPIREAMFRINQVTDWVNRIITLDGLLQRITLIRSLVAYQKDALTVWWTSIHKPLAGQRAADYAEPLQPASAREAVDDVMAYVQRHEGTDVARVDENVRDLWIQLRAM